MPRSRSRKLHEAFAVHPEGLRHLRSNRSICLHQTPDFDAERCCNFLDHIDRDIMLAAFDTTDVSPVQATRRGEPFLAPPLVRPQNTHVAGQRLPDSRM
jgi:hypothetical protein